MAEWAGMVKRTRVIAVVTGSRADFGLLSPVMRAIRRRRALSLRVIAAGLHLSTGTWRDIQRVGFEISARVPMQRRGKVGRGADVEAMGRGVRGFGRVFNALQPDVVVALGDRIEAFAAASAAQVGGVHLAHLHGGDRAQGVSDEAMRHAIAKLAHVHFCATSASRKRLIRMGEVPQRVFVVGSPALDGLDVIKPMSNQRLGEIGLDSARPFVVVLQHPVGREDATEQRWMIRTLEAAWAVKKKWRLGLAVFMPNDDPGSGGIRRAIAAFEASKSTADSLVVLSHLPREQYLALLRRAAALVGNSSGGLIEAAALRTVGGISSKASVVGFREVAGLPVVNIGPRQSGRQRPRNVLDCGYGRAPVKAALERALCTERRRLHQPYGDGRSGERIAGLLAGLAWQEIPLRKRNRY